MSNKCFMGLAPALVIASFALMPAVAQAKFPATCVVEAKCHYYINSTSPSPATILKEGEDRATLSWGEAHVLDRGRHAVTCQPPPWPISKTL